MNPTEEIVMIVVDESEIDALTTADGGLVLRNKMPLINPYSVRGYAFKDINNKWINETIIEN
jgi:hypothetical protein